MKLTALRDPEAIRRFAHLRPAPWIGAGRCGAAAPGSSHTCTREAGHRGPHVAHGFFRRPQVVWEGDPSARPSDSARRRVRDARSGGSIRTGRDGGVLLGLGKRLLRIVTDVEELSLFILFVAFVYFAVDWLIRIAAGG